MEKILVSIIIPAYNIRDYIGRCLESVMQQSHQLIEIIVVDDGSTDGTWEVIKQYAEIDQRIMAIHKDNGGVSSARLMGIEKARGEYIGFVDGDDYIEPYMYKHLLQNALKYSADISHCGYKMIYPDGHIDYYYGTNQIIEQSHNSALMDLMRGNKIEPSLGNKLYHRKVVEGFWQSPLWDNNIRINEDLLMNYLFFKKAVRSIYEDKALYHYILRKGSAATTKKERYKIIDPLRVIMLIKEDVKENDELTSIIYQRYLRALINVVTQKDWKDSSEEARKKLKTEISTGNFNNLCGSIKLRLMVIGVTYLGSVYRLIRRCYEIVSGISQKYAV